MFFVKKVFLCLLFATLMYYGGAGTQSDNTSLQGMGFVSVVLAFVVLYILFKIMWSTVSFFFSFAIIGAVVLFILYCLGIIGSDSAGGKMVQQAFSENEMPAGYSLNSNSDEQKLAELEQTAVNGSTGGEPVEEDGFFSKISSIFGKNESEPTQISNFNPLDYPEVTGVPGVITGSVLRVKGINIKLLGADAPNPNQTCSDSHGLSYSCGHKAITWLQNWLNGREVKCHILGNVVQHRATGVCFLGQYDVAAAVVGAGWAVAYTRNTSVYVPYEKQARTESKGLWRGRFYRPSDWRKLQSKQAEAAAKAQEKSSSWFNFDGWF